MKIFRLSREDRCLWLPQLRQLEQSIDYPFGDDRFRIDHGPEYFEFFDRLGETVCYIATDDFDLAAIGIAVLRSLPHPNTAAKAWYLCDLKVSPKFRGRGLTTKLFKSGFLSCYLKSSKAYGISMNPSDGRPNPVVKLLGNLPWAPLKVASQLQIYSLDYETMTEASLLLKKYRGQLTYLSHAGRKDLILKSTNTALPLLHAQFGPCADHGLNEPQKGFAHMFCCLDKDPLIAELKKLNCDPYATAALLHFNLKKCDWNFVLTSDL